ncbi:hypothetical protein BS1321_13310 [Peribacillus simplex NBRC 15720 = DSM 1321]|uniref:Uncharacterized protein n=1 Tax=Peribacillus simplex NBRC 15720 = DSM 1321 TaxID=1349754 RepID=A0A223EHX7_9BACI|nr:hypothetical protein BS1321_13310 [Peribacillus simplex NBRC 15720 = DSM 1321]
MQQVFTIKKQDMVSSMSCFYLFTRCEFQFVTTIKLDLKDNEPYIQNVKREFSNLQVSPRSQCGPLKVKWNRNEDEKE